MFTWVPLLCFRLVRMLFPLGLAWWEVCPLMPHGINLGYLGSLTTALMCLVVDIEDSIFLANCLTLLAGNLSRSMFESLMVLETNSSSFRKNHNISLCKILAVSDGCFARTNWAWTALYHSLTYLFPCLKLVSRSNLALNSFVCCLHKSSYFDQITSKLKSSGGSTMAHTNPYQTFYSTLSLSCISLLQQVHNQEYSHISASIWEVSGTSYHSQSNPSWALQYNALTLVT